MESRFDYPDRVGRSSCYNTCVRGCDKVYPRILLAVVEVVGNDLFSIAVGEEVDRAGRDDSYKCWP